LKEVKNSVLPGFGQNEEKRRESYVTPAVFTIPPFNESSAV